MNSLRVFVTALIIALVAGLWASPSAVAAKQWSPLAVSLSGHQWSGHLKHVLFKNVTMVPGETRTRHFYVRNRGEGQARLKVKVVLHDPSRLARTQPFRFSIGHHGAWRRITTSGQQGATFLIPQGGTDKLLVRARFLPTATNNTQLRSLSFELKLRLTHQGR